MEHFYVHSSTIDSEEFVDATPAQRGTWLCLLRYCCGQENGGRIPMASEFHDRKWQQLTGVTLAEVLEDCRLWEWVGSDLVLNFYPHEKEAIVQHRRAVGRTGGKASAQAKAQAKAQAHAYSDAATSQRPLACGDASTDAQAHGSTEEKRREEIKEKREHARGGDVVPQIPAWEEFQAVFMADGIPDPYLRRQWERFEERRDWLNGRGELVDWQRTVRNRWSKDRATWRPDKAATGPTAAAMSPSVRRIAVQKELSEVTAELNHQHSTGQPLDEKLRAREKSLRMTLERLDAEAEGGAK